jgi:hypothetical protein
MAQRKYMKGKRPRLTKDTTMTDTALLKRIMKMTNSELERRASNAYTTAYCETYGTDYEAKADAIQEYEALADEQKRRKGLEPR